MNKLQSDHIAQVDFAIVRLRRLREKAEIAKASASQLIRSIDSELGTLQKLRDRIVSEEEG